MKHKYGVSADGISVLIAWFFCCGMMYADPQNQTRHDIRRLNRLPDGAIQTEEDVTAINRILKKCVEYQLLETGEIRELLACRNPFYALSLQDVA